MQSVFGILKILPIFFLALPIASAEDLCPDLGKWRDYYHKHPNPENRKGLAVRYNNCAFLYLKENNWNRSEALFNTALELDPGNSLFSKNLGILYARKGIDAADRRRWGAAEVDLIKAYDLVPGDEDILGRLVGVMMERGIEFFEDNDLGRAQNAFEKVLRYDRRNSAAKMWLSRVLYLTEGKTEKARDFMAQAAAETGDVLPREHINLMDRQIQVEKKTREERFGNWVLRYDESMPGFNPGELAGWIDEIAFGISRDMGYTVKRRLVFVVVDAMDFSEIHGGPHWSAGINDGRIKIPYRSADMSGERLKHVLAHEYTHSVINDLSRGNEVPFWFHEGMAEYQAIKTTGKEIKDPANFSELIPAIAGRYMIPMEFLSDPAAATEIDGPHVALAYQQALAFVLYLEEEFRFHSLMSFLDELGKGRPVEQALAAGIGRRLSVLEDEFSQWATKQPWLR